MKFWWIALIFLFTQGALAVDCNQLIGDLTNFPFAQEESRSTQIRILPSTEGNAPDLAILTTLQKSVSRLTPFLHNMILPHEITVQHSDSLDDISTDSFDLTVGLKKGRIFLGTFFHELGHVLWRENQPRISPEDEREFLNIRNRGHGVPHLVRAGYEEIFSDIIAVVGTGDRSIISKELEEFSGKGNISYEFQKSIDMRDFAKQHSVEDVLEPCEGDCHLSFAPVRSFIGEHYLRPDKINRYRDKIATALLNACISEQWELTKLDQDWHSMNQKYFYEFVNRRLIEKLKMFLP